MTGPADVSTTPLSASEHAARYEALRCHVLERYPTPASRDGLAVVLSRGVATWMDAWSALPAPAVRAVQEERYRAPLPDGTSAEIIHVLAAMALGHIHEVRTSCNPSIRR
jgi:hypothetical protein